MTPDQILKLLEGGIPLSGFASLCLVCWIWANRVTDLSVALNKRMDELCRKQDRFATAMTELAMTLIAQAPPESRQQFVETLKDIVKEKEDCG